MKKIKCRICGNEYLQITNSHLKSHGMTPQEYKNMFPDAILRIVENTKGIWDDSISKYKYIKHPDRPKVKCQLCNKEYYRISTTHMQRIHHIDLADYKEMYPNAQLYITTDKERELISKNHADVRGENNSQWLGGLSKNEYVYNWRKIRDLALEYYGRICYKCGSTHYVCVHHIDYCKKNNYLGNLIPLCLSCHIKTNWHREIWYRLFSCGLPNPSIDSGFREFMSNHIDNLTVKREEEIEEEIIC